MGAGAAHDQVGAGVSGPDGVPDLVGNDLANGAFDGDHRKARLVALLARAARARRRIAGTLPLQEATVSGCRGRSHQSPCLGLACHLHA
jgi:hypothetical protein